MDIFMHGRKELLEKYVNLFFNDINIIQKYRTKIDFNLLHARSEDFEYEMDFRILDIVFMHYIYKNNNGIQLLDRSTNRNYGEEERNLLEILSKLIKKKEYTNEELYHIYCSKNKDEDSYDINSYHAEEFKDPIFEVALKRLFFYLYETTDTEKIYEEIRKECRAFGANEDNYLKVANNILGLQFETKRDVESIIYNEQIRNFNGSINCGGFALEIFNWVDLNNVYDSDTTISRILQNPSVRLLGDTKLQDDEYLVVFNPLSYHFIKQNYNPQEKSEISRFANYEFVEKLGQTKVSGFDGWVVHNAFADSPCRNFDDLAYFAVKKNHDMNYKYPAKGYEDKPMSFAGMLSKTIKDGVTDTFEYHCREYKVEKVKRGKYNIISNGEIVGTAQSNKKSSDRYDIRLFERFVDYVRNIKSEYYAQKYEHILNRFIDSKEYYKNVENLQSVEDEEMRI